MTVSVVIPTYAHRDYVPAALASVFAQTFDGHEVIVVNDGSPDDTAELLRPLAAAGRIRYVEQPNGGQAAARNRGLAEARGEFVAFLDDDDRWPADKLEWQVRALRERPDCVLAYGPHANLSADGATLADEPNQSPHAPADDAYAAFRQQCWILSIGQTLIRTRALREAGGFDPSIWGSDDWEMYIRLAKIGGFCYQPRIALHYRRHATNASASALRHAANHLKVVRRHIGLLNVPLLVRHQRAASRYFLGRLLRYAGEARAERRYRESLKAQLCALAFRPSLVAQPRWLRPAIANVLARPPRDAAAASAGGAARPRPVHHPTGNRRVR